MDTIHIRGLRVETLVGVHAWEQKLARPLVLDLEIGADAARAAATDALADTADYHAIAQALAAFAAEHRCQLVETFAEHAAQLLLERFALARVRLTVHKPGAVRDAQDVSVTVAREASRPER